MSKRQMPKELFAWWQGYENDDPCISASADSTGLDDGTLVGVYQLVQVRRVKINYRLEPETQGREAKP